ncbi:hypothetical protein [Gluconobacter kanchanaburiensis]|uniref:Cysteine rich repeat protein n=1 Tax=Gluconobacter kanchanaburiensis NBRC 103587 TaxID=1307948 RepID=A0A511B4F3_9PROT|nr:hypothetical protein [Gluconobacter kanchanaburiensis]MBF0861619.1 hypothetical protein [Gluconobacter kanchanaburiensis]GBR67101.1 hypothetical protein AA103587_0113 [Gluconobacter kanchanaburiensis NBRC 103587]GEK95264.1 hypothetical protein GKA01_04610 [Gluconobacter kanchanaburiensis NBRC 103587]
MSRYFIALTALTVTVALGPVQAASAATRDQQKAACQGDAIRLCTFAIPNEAKITACMKKKLDQLSPKCRAMFAPLQSSQKKPAPKPKPV